MQKTHDAEFGDLSTNRLTKIVADEFEANDDWSLQVAEISRR